MDELLQVLVFGSLALGAVLKFMGRPIGDREVNPDPRVVLCARAGNALLVGGAIGLVAGIAM